MVFLRVSLCSLYTDSLKKHTPICFYQAAEGDVTEKKLGKDVGLFDSSTPLKTSPKGYLRTEKHTPTCGFPKPGTHTCMAAPIL